MQTSVVVCIYAQSAVLAETLLDLVGLLIFS